MNSQALINQAIDIGDSLLLESIKTKDGWYWESVEVKNKELTWSVNESIYSGTSGILLFFIELYKTTEDLKYRKAILKGLKWIISYCDDTPTYNYSFYNGRMGVVYLLVKAYETLNIREYINHAKIIAKDCDKFLLNEVISYELLNGISGTILGLLHLHNIVEEDWVITKISKFTDRLIRGIKFAEKGIFWDLDVQKSAGLCGFSHGNAGIGFVLNEASNYLENEEYHELANEAFRYENSHYSSSSKNWPDYRKIIYDANTLDSYKKKFKKGNTDFFSEPKFISAWCHGAPGIGFSRVRAQNLFPSKENKRGVYRALENSKNKILELRNADHFTICHGFSSVILFLVYANNMLTNEYDCSVSSDVDKRVLKVFQNKWIYNSGYKNFREVEDSSLFMGKAGIGYFCLKYHYDSKESILAPHVDIFKRKTSGINLFKEKSTKSKSSTFSTIFESNYPRTCFVLKYLLDIGELSQSKINFNYFGLSKYRLLIDNLKDSINKNFYRIVDDIFEFETKKMLLLDTINPSLHFIKNQVYTESITNLLTQDKSILLSKKYQLSDSVSLIGTNWNWDFEKNRVWSENFLFPPKVVNNFFITTPTEIKEINNISEFSVSLVNEFKTPNSINSIYYKWSSLKKMNSKEKKLLSNSIYEQTLKLLEAHIIIPSQLI